MKTRRARENRRYEPDSGIHQAVEEPGVSPRENALVVMARYPQPGTVKTRLAASIGAAEAATLYRAFLQDLGSRLSAHSSWLLHWAFEPASSAFRAELAADDDAFAQSDGDLGARMQAAMTRVLAAGARSVVLIGSDVPHIPLGTVEEAFRRLAAGADLVLGPAQDGGYYLIGARSAPPVFDGVRWGSADVLAATLAAARRASIEPQLLEELYDVDDLADAARLYHDMTGAQAADLRATRASLERLHALGYI